MSRAFGDFQTPPGLVAAVLARLGPVGERWPRVLEPTCGRGRFLDGLLALDPPPREILGIEIQADHARESQAIADGAGGGVRVGVTHANLFDLDLGKTPTWTGDGPLLVVGNPPWVTNAELGSLGSGNHPAKRNLKRANGLDAMTGAANFDLAEAVWLKVLTELADQRPTVALLCKVAVARAVLEHASRMGLPVASASLIKVDARVWFKAAVEACLLCVAVGPGPGWRPAPIESSCRHPESPPPLAKGGQGGVDWGDGGLEDGFDPPVSPLCKGGRASSNQGRTPPGPGLERIPVYESLDAREPSAAMGFVRGRLVADLDAYDRYSYADGSSRPVWRQGLKHDAAAVMELSAGDGGLRNGLGEPVAVEPGHVFPLLKGSDLARPGAGLTAVRPARSVVVTQRKVGDDTAGLGRSAPRLWSYLRSHADIFTKRKSSVYLGGPAFAMFGVGPYSFSPYKVAVSALHRSPVFRAVGPAGGEPVMVDDTCYFLPCESPEQAALLAHVLNSPGSLGLLSALNFPGSKRSVTKAALARLDLNALLARADRAEWLARAGPDAERLAGRLPIWPERLECLHGGSVTPEHLT